MVINHKIYRKNFRCDFMAKKIYEVELNFPKDMDKLEKKMSEVLADIVYKKFGPEGSMSIAEGLEKRLD